MNTPFIQTNVIRVQFCRSRWYFHFEAWFLLLRNINIFATHPMVMKENLKVQENSLERSYKHGKSGIL